MDQFKIKLLIISSIHISLLTIVLHNFKFKKKIFNYFSSKQNFLFYLLMSLVFFGIYFLNQFIWNINQKSMFLFNFVLLTIWYFELAVYLEKFFWRDFLRNELPSSINYVLSFTLMINAGYFTLMFIYRLMEAERVF